MEHESDNDTSHSWSPWNNPEKLGKDIGGTENPKKNWNYPDHSTAEIG